MVGDGGPGVGIESFFFPSLLFLEKVRVWASEKSSASFRSQGGGAGQPIELVSFRNLLVRLSIQGRRGRSR